MDIVSFGLWVWKVLSFLLDKLGGKAGEKLINSIEKPVFQITPDVVLKEWLYDGVTSEEKPIYYGGTVTPGLIQIPGKLREPRYFALLKIRNVTKHNGENSTAKRLFAKLAFYKYGFTEILLSDIYGKWAESIEPPMALDKDSLKYIDLGPEDEKTLDAATRYYIHNDWYAVSTESYTADQFENTKNLIREPNQSFNVTLEVFDVKVELNAANVRETRYFRIINRGRNNKPEMIELKYDKRRLTKRAPDWRVRAAFSSIFFGSSRFR